MEENAWDERPTTDSTAMQERGDGRRAVLPIRSSLLTGGRSRAVQCHAWIGGFGA